MSKLSFQWFTDDSCEKPFVIAQFHTPYCVTGVSAVNFEVELGAVASISLFQRSSVRIPGRHVYVSHIYAECLFSFQRLSAGVHDRHDDGVHAAVPQTGAHPKTLPRYHPSVSPLSSALLPSPSLSPRLLCRTPTQIPRWDNSHSSSSSLLGAHACVSPLVHICFAHTSPNISPRAKAPPSGGTVTLSHSVTINLCRGYFTESTEFKSWNSIRTEWRHLHFGDYWISLFACGRQ